MGTSIRRSINIRVAFAIFSVLLFSVMTTVNIMRIQNTQGDIGQAGMLLQHAQKAEAAHYKWASNLSSALYAGTEFTGSLDHTACVLGQWLYGGEEVDNAEVTRLRQEIEPLHKQLHQSAETALNLLTTDPAQAHAYYQSTIQGTLTTLVGLLDEVVDCGVALGNDATGSLHKTVMLMHIVTCICLALALICLISLVLYVLHAVVRPLLYITDETKTLREGSLRLKLDVRSKNELGRLARTLEQSMARIHDYVDDINRIMAELSRGNFNVSTSTHYVGDFRSIEESLHQFTSALSVTLGNIYQTERRVAGNAEQLSSGAHALAQGATEQASAVQQLYATVDNLSKSSEKNVQLAAGAQSNAEHTSEQVNLSGRQMQSMVSAMTDIAEASEQIGKIISTIEDIAFQTNILALNAAVEAARAGAAGKGFAVVADEVRSLASKSDEAAKATKDLIENSIQATTRGTEIVGQVSESLHKTLDLVMDSNRAIGAIAKAIEEEAESLSQVSEGIGQISSVVQTNSASSEESAAVSSELFHQVHLLEEETKKFQLRENSYSTT